MLLEGEGEVREALSAHRDSFEPSRPLPGALELCGICAAGSCETGVAAPSGGLDHSGSFEHCGSAPSFAVHA